MIRVALVGIGGMGRCHFNCYKNVANAELVAVCDVRTERAREIAGPDMPIYESLDEMLPKKSSLTCSTSARRAICTAR